MGPWLPWTPAGSPHRSLHVSFIRSWMVSWYHRWPAIHHLHFAMRGHKNKYNNNTIQTANTMVFTFFLTNMSQYWTFFWAKQTSPPIFVGNVGTEKYRVGNQVTFSPRGSGISTVFQRPSKIEMNLPHSADGKRPWKTLRVGVQDFFGRNIYIYICNIHIEFRMFKSLFYGLKWAYASFKYMLAVSLP